MTARTMTSQTPLLQCREMGSCNEIKLVVEIDGEVHKEKYQMHYDRERDAVIESKGLQIAIAVNAVALP